MYKLNWIKKFKIKLTIKYNKKIYPILESIKSYQNDKKILKLNY